MPAILGANSTSGYEISNSLRFNDNDSAYLGRTPGSAGTSVQTWTFSCWAKRSTLSGSQVIFGASNGDASQFVDITINGNNVFELDILDSNSTRTIRTTTAIFRDPSAWYHFVIVVDTTQSTDTNRLKLYVNGDEIATSAGTGTFPAQNANTQVNATTGVHAIGRRQGSTDRYYDGYLTEINHVDGQALTPTSFGEEDANGVWIPKKYSGNYGTNGFFLQFKQTGTSQNASGIGADTSGNTHHWTVNNLAALDVTTDTCTNNFATLNPNNMGANTVLREAALLVNNADNHATIFPTIMPTTGKWYFEAKMTVNAVLGLGFRTDSNTPETAYSDESNKYYFYLNNDNAYRIVEAANTALGANLNNTSSTFQVAIDFDAAKYYMGRDDTWYAADWGTDGDPASGANPSYDLADGTSIFPFIMVAGGTWAVNFGNPVVAISSGNADANGHGNFEFAPPSGFFALCTKNLAEHG